jgi:zinc transport system substrate-binding protein
MKKSFFLFFLILVSPLFFSCQGKTSKRAKPQVLVSIPPYLYFVNKIAGDNVEAICLTPEGANPHVYEPTAKQTQNIHQAKIWVRVGEGFEKKIEKCLTYHNPDLQILNLTENETLIDSEDKCSCPHHHESLDLHIWMSPLKAQKQAQRIADALIQAFPEHEEIFSSRLSTFIQELDNTHNIIKEKLKPFAHQAILVSHPSFGYFCKDYDLEQISIEVEGKDPRPKDVSRIVEKAQSTPVRLVIIQDQHNNKGAQTIAELLQLRTATIDPYTSKYDQMLLNVASSIENSHE